MPSQNDLCRLTWLPLNDSVLNFINPSLPDVTSVRTTNHSNLLKMNFLKPPLVPRELSFAGWKFRHLINCAGIMFLTRLSAGELVEPRDKQSVSQRQCKSIVNGLIKS